MLFFKKCNKTFFLTVNIQIKRYSNLPNSNLTSLIEKMKKVTRETPKMKVQNSKFISGRISLQVLGTGAEGAPRSLYVFTDHSKYLFNCGEGTQRLAHEHKMKLSKLEHVFVTQKSWKNIGGLPGLSLTIQDAGVPQITLHGPRGLEELFTATKRFVILRDLAIETADCESGNAFVDNVMSVTYVPIGKEFEAKAEGTNDKMETEGESTKGPQEKTGTFKASLTTKQEQIRNLINSTSPNSSDMKHEIVEDNIDYYAHELSGRRSVVTKQPDAARLNKLRNLKEKNTVMCYICKLHSRPGALNIQKCVKLGIQSGPMYGRLKSGHDVTLTNGVVVRSKDVCNPDIPGPIFIVVDCPSEEYLKNFVEDSTFYKHQAYARPDEMAYVVVHFTPQEVMNNPRYQEWIAKFSRDTLHMVLNEGNSCMGSVAVHRAQYKLNMLHSTIFPLLGDTGIKIQDPVSDAKKIRTDDKNTVLPIEANSSKPDPKNIIRANTFSICNLRPKSGIDRSQELKLVPSEYLEEPNKVEGFIPAFQELKNGLEKYKTLSNKKYPRILFLGTGSCIPSKTRNTSGVLLELSENTNILLDCGEGTYGQLVRFYGPGKVDQVLSKIKGVFISHLHADHHLGLIGLIQGRGQAIKRLNLTNTNPLLLLAPKQILVWLNFFDRYFESICDEFEIIDNASLNYDEPTLFEGTRVRVLLSLEMCDINTAKVRHCPYSYGVAFNHRSGYKICYSGDTMPAENLINIGQNCDLLIHEATMEDELENEALSKMHSTTSQAIEVGRNMNAANILLTHFSQRYAKLPRFNDNFRDNIGIAFDNMHISFDLLPVVPLLYPSLKLMFAEHYEDLENKALKRQLRNARDCSPETSQPKRPNTTTTAIRNA